MKVLVYQQGEELHRVVPNYKIGETIESIRDAHPPEAVELDNESMPSHYLRESWKLENGAVTIDLPKAKTIAHGIRRERREEYFKPRIEIIQKDSLGIPSGQNEKTAAEARAENAAYKAQDDLLQETINAATNESEILNALGLE